MTTRKPLILLGFLKKCCIATRTIHYKLNEAKAEAIYSYEIIKGYEFDDKVIFEADSIDEEMLKKEKKVYETKEFEGRGIYQYYKVDSEGEYDFAKNLDEDPNVVLFTKIKKGGFVIDTPYGNYSPDWAIVYKEEEGDTKLYFITETKFEKEWKDLTDVEKLKIKCGTLHFKAVSEATKDRVCFNWANSYENFKEKIGIE